MWRCNSLIVAAVDHQLEAFRGTPIVPIFYRAMGASVGTNVQIFLETIFADFEALELGDYVFIGKNTVIQGHNVFNSFTLEPITLMDGCSVIGLNSVLVSNVTLNNNVILGSTSTVMRGDVLVGGTWAGNVATRCCTKPQISPARKPEFQFEDLSPS